MINKSTSGFKEIRDTGMDIHPNSEYMTIDNAYNG